MTSTIRSRQPAQQPPQATRTAWQALPWLLRVAALYSACLTMVAIGVYLVAVAFARVAPLALALVAALLLTALVEPVATGCCRLGAPRWLAALVALLTVLVVIALPVILGWTQMQAQFTDLGGTLDSGLDKVRDYLVNGPLGLDGTQVDAVRDGLNGLLPNTAADLLTGAATALEVLTAGLLTAFLLFFLIKDGAMMWAWFIQRLPTGQRARIDDAGRLGWHVLARYTRGVVIVGGVDAVGIGLVLVIMRVPLALPLILLTFLAEFIPYLGAWLAGAAAVLVTLVSNGPTDALIILAAVLTVQCLEGYLLEPLIVGRAVRLHPAAVLLAVAVGGLTAGVGGAVIAVPLLAVAYRVTLRLRHPPRTGIDQPAPVPSRRPDG